MKILQLSTSDIHGGAAKACHRLVKGLKSIDEPCEMLVKYKLSNEPFVHDIGHEPNQKHGKSSLLTFVQENYVNRQRTELSNTLFSVPFSGYDVACLDLVRTADVINLHWIAGFQSPRTIARLASLGKPVVWTLHDQWPFTGGCHYSAGCMKYRNTCSPCPQLLNDADGLIPALLQDKIHYFEDAPITIVSPSRWLAECARESTIFCKHRVETIPNSLETDTFSPLAKKAARMKLGLQEDGLILLFGSENGAEKRKGFSELLSAMRSCMESENFAGRVRDRTLSVLCFGHPAKELKSSGLHVIPLGFLESDEQVRIAYCAADIFILPSLEDNFPNTMLESISCGIPVIAFNTGGMQDVITHDHHGLLVPSGDTAALCNAILSLTSNPIKRDLLSRNCREAAVEKFALEVQARKYLELYKDLLTRSAPGKPCTADRHDGSCVSDTAVVQYLPGPNLQKMYGRFLFKSFVLAIRRSEIDLTGFMHRAAAAVRGLMEELSKMNGRKGGRFLSLFASSILAMINVLRSVYRIIKRRRAHE